MQEVLYQTKRIDKPDIIAVIGQRVALRRAGREFLGLCPFHNDKHPSFAVNSDKGVFHCHGCHVGGDVITFVQQIDGLTFPEALKSLGMNGEQPRRRVLTPSRQRAAELAASWGNEQRAKLNRMIADTMEQRDLADEIEDFELADIFDRELVMLHGFYDALAYPNGAAEMHALRPSIKSTTDGTEVSL